MTDEQVAVEETSRNRNLKWAFLLALLFIVVVLVAVYKPHKNWFNKSGDTSPRTFVTPAAPKLEVPERLTPDEVLTELEKALSDVKLTFCEVDFSELEDVKLKLERQLTGVKIDYKGILTKAQWKRIKKIEKEIKKITKLQIAIRDYCNPVEKPAKPAKPEKPAKPAKPEKPAPPAAPAKPEKPAPPKKPVGGDKPVTSVTIHPAASVNAEAEALTVVTINGQKWLLVNKRVVDGFSQPYICGELNGWCGINPNPSNFKVPADNWKLLPNKDDNWTWAFKLSSEFYNKEFTVLSENGEGPTYKNLKWDLLKLRDGKLPFGLINNGGTVMKITITK